MISVTRVLTFEQYAASNYLALRHGTFKRRFCYFAYLRLGPLLAIIGLPVALWLMVHAWRAPGQHGAEFGASCGLAWYFGYLGFYPLLFKRKMRKLYREQELSLPWTIELSQEDIHSVIQGRSDTRFQWVYFNSFVGTNGMFTLLKKQRPVFLTIAKENLQPREQDELRSLLLAKLGPAL